MIKRIFVEKKQGYDIEAQKMQKDLTENLGICGIKKVRVLIRYDISGLGPKYYEAARQTVFSEPSVDNVYDEAFPFSKEERVFAMAFLPGQYDQRADFAEQCLQMLIKEEKPTVRVAKVISITGDVSDDEFQKIKDYYINPVESQEVDLKKPQTLEMDYRQPGDVEVVSGFITEDEEGLEEIAKRYGVAMDLEDILFCQKYFKDFEKRDPTITELRVLDTYWSDHCRHTTFLTKLEEIKFEDKLIESIYNTYLSDREGVYGDKEKDVTLMDMATMIAKKLKKEGVLTALDESEEVNACSIKVDVDVDGKTEPYLVMFKNETHNHPTEIEPFGGASTCLGGAIRDPLSGRAYVYQAMRITGSGDPRKPIEETLSGKLAQRKITTTAAEGYSSYGNQIGLSAGFVNEIYHDGYVAKRMELGAVVAAAPAYNVVREVPQPGDVILLLGGKTGRDGCGGATGSSKAHTEDSLLECGAEVQKGNPIEERKMQRLFRNPELTRLIKRCNDFGAGGVSVAIGELADGLLIDLDTVPTKYEGLSGTDLAISESQERMAVVISAKDKERFVSLAESENLQATQVAVVTEEKRLVMTWRGKTIVNISREFLNTSGVKKTAWAKVPAVDYKNSYFINASSQSVQERWLETLADLNVCSQKGLIEQFDSTAGGGSVLLPLGGKHQLTPEQAMAAKIPVLNASTNTATVMAFGFNPNLSSWSPFHGALYAVVESVAKVVAKGGNYKTTYLTFQEYFERLGDEPLRWGKPVCALLGAYHAQRCLNIASIGGKDSMSGSFLDLDVPPTLVSFAIDAVDARKVVSGEFKKENSKVVLVEFEKEENYLPVFDDLKSKYEEVTRLINSGKVLSSYVVTGGGLCEAISKMAFGNKIGFTFENVKDDELFAPSYGSIILEVTEDVEFGRVIGRTGGASICGKGFSFEIDKLISVWSGTLEEVFPTKTDDNRNIVEKFAYDKRNTVKPSIKSSKPTVFIPIFPGTNCEYETAWAFKAAGANVDLFVVKNLTSKDVEETVKEMAKRIKNAQILMLAGGASAGNEPDGAGRFIATTFRHSCIAQEVENLLSKRDGLILGIGNGFHALIKLGLVPYGEIRPMSEQCPTLTYNTIGRHSAGMAYTAVTSVLSPWFANVNLGDIHAISVSTGEGRFVADEDTIWDLAKNGQIAAQYVDLQGNPTNDIMYNPSGSMYAIEAVTSPDGRVLGKMGHSERVGERIAINIPGNKNQKIFESGVNYFK